MSRRYIENQNNVVLKVWPEWTFDGISNENNYYQGCLRGIINERE